MIGMTQAVERNPALFVTGLNRIEIKDRPLEAVGENQVRMECDFTMISSGTELHWLQGTHSKRPTYPYTPGYSAAGRIIGMGKGVAERHPELALGQRVVAMVPHGKLHNVDADGLVRIPDNVESEDAAATVVMSVSMRGVRGGKVRIGDSVAVFGLGIIGLYTVHLAKVAGACPVIAVDPIGRRRLMASALGADVTIDPTSEDVRKAVFDATDGEGARVLIDATGTPSVISALPDLAAEYGRIVVLGGIHAPVSMDLYTRFQKGNLTMVGCGTPYPEDYPFTQKRNEQALLAMMRYGMLRPREVMTHIVEWQHALEMYRMLAEEKDQAIGVVLNWREP